VDFVLLEVPGLAARSLGQWRHDKDRRHESRARVRLVKDRGGLAVSSLPAMTKEGHMTEHDKDIDALILSYGDQEEAALYERFPLLARTLENMYYTDPDPDGFTVWVRDRTLARRDEPNPGQHAAEEVRQCWILQQLQAMAARVDRKE
jgi:hypothetical protein